EGASSAAFTGLATFTDPPGAEPVANYTALIHWGDGSTSAGTVVNIGGNNFRVDAPPHPYTEARSSTITPNATPVIAPTLPVTGPSIPVTRAQLTRPPAPSTTLSRSEGASSAAFTGLATFTDPPGAEPVANYTTLIHWGDGSTSAGTVVNTGGNNFRVDAP